MKRLLSYPRVRNGIVGLLLAATVGVWLTAARYRNAVGIASVRVELEANDQNRFLSPEIVQRLAVAAATEAPERPYRAVHTALQGSSYLRDIEMVITAERELKVAARVRMPVARLLGPKGSLYMDTSGELFPWSPAFTARVPLVRVPTSLSDTATEAGRALLADWRPALLALHADPLLRALIAEVDLGETGEGVMWTSVGNLQVELGRPDGHVEKFAALKSFATEVLSHTGWGYYRSIDLRYGGQVVARKR